MLRKFTTFDYVRFFQQGDERGFDHFFREIYPALCFFAARVIGDPEAAKDIASAAFIKAWEKHERLHTAEGIRAYLYQIVRNDCYKWLQLRRRSAAVGKDLEVLSPALESAHEALLIQAEVLRDIYSAMNELPPGCREVFGKLYIEGKSISETALELGLSRSTIKTQKARGLSFFRRRLSME